MLIGIFVFLPFIILMGLFVASPNPIWAYYTLGILIVFLTIMIPFGGLAIMRSDIDYLFILPLKKRDLAVSFYITQFIATGISFLFAFGYVLPFLARNVVEAVMLSIDLVLIAMMITAFSIVAYRMGNRGKTITVVALAIWTISPLAGFSYTYSSVFFGNFLYGTVLTILVSIPVNLLAIKQLGTIELGFTKMSTRFSSEIYKNQIRYSKYSGIKSIYILNLLQLNLTSRMNIGASTSSRAARIKIQHLLVPVIIFAVVYAIICPYFENGSDINTAVLIGTIYIGMIIPMLFSQSVISYERAWLSFTSMPAYRYWRSVILAKFIQISIVTIPFFFASVYLYFAGVRLALNTLPIFALTIPSVSLIMIYISGFVTMDQMKEVGTMPSQMNLRQVIIVLPVILIVVVVSISVIVWTAGLISSLAVFCIMLLIVFRKGPWINLVYRLTERGYV